MHQTIGRLHLAVQYGRILSSQGVLFTYLCQFSARFNWSNPAVCDAVLSVQRFWYEKGVDGFRLDVFNAYCKDMSFRNNPRRRDPIGSFMDFFTATLVRNISMIEIDQKLLHVLKSLERWRINTTQF